MTSPELSPRPAKGENALAFSIMFFCVALLCLMLGWADGVRHGRAYLQFPPTDGWFVATLVLVGLGVLFLIWSRVTRRS